MSEASDLLDESKREDAERPIEDWRKHVEFAEWLSKLDDRALAATKDFVATYGPKLFEIAVGIAGKALGGLIDRELQKRIG